MFELIGIIGGVLAVALYYLLTAGKLTATCKPYLFGQLITVTLMLISLSVNFNAGAAIINVFWLLITANALIRGTK